jgi:hypothetical protein
MKWVYVISISSIFIFVSSMSCLTIKGLFGILLSVLTLTWQITIPCGSVAWSFFFLCPRYEEEHLKPCFRAFGSSSYEQGQ